MLTHFSTKKPHPPIETCFYVVISNNHHWQRPAFWTKKNQSKDSIHIASRHMTWHHIASRRMSTTRGARNCNGLTSKMIYKSTTLLKNRPPIGLSSGFWISCQAFYQFLSVPIRLQTDEQMVEQIGSEENKMEMFRIIVGMNEKWRFVLRSLIENANEFERFRSWKIPWKSNGDFSLFCLSIFFDISK